MELTHSIDSKPTLIAPPGEPAIIIVPKMTLDVWNAEKFMCRLIDVIELARKHDGDPL